MKTRRTSRLLRASVSILLCIASQNAGRASAGLKAPVQETTWVRYSAKGTELSFELPDNPTSITVSRADDFEAASNPSGRLYSVYDDGVVYLVLTFDNQARKESLDAFADKIEAIEEYPITPKSQKFEKKVKLDGIAGKQFRIEGRLSGRVCFYTTGNHAYIVEVITEDMTKPGIGKFFASLSLKSDVKSKEIPDTWAPEPDEVTPAATQSGEASAASRIEVPPGVFRGREVARGVLVVVRPRPGYTEMARKHRVAGTVVLRAVLRSSGKITNIRVVSGLPFGLNEQATNALRNMRFIPAIKDEHYVSTYVQFEYNFNLE